MEQIDSRITKINNGEVIVQEDSPAYYAYILKEGKARVLKNVDGRQLLIGTINKGDIFGEMAFLGETRRTASVIADGDVKVEMISKDTFMEFIDKLPLDVRTRMHAMVSSLTSITAINGRLAVLSQTIRDIEAKMIDAKTFETETEKMPEFMRLVAVAITGRLNMEVDRLGKLKNRVEGAVRTDDPLLLTVSCQ